jgi:hypothetical protein
MTSNATVSARLGLQQFGTFQLIPLSSVSASKRAAGAVQSASSSADPSNAPAPGGVSYNPAVSNLPGAAQSKRIRNRCGKGESHQEAADASLTSGAARQKAGHVVVRHFRDWLLCYNAYKPGRLAASSLLWKSSKHGKRISDSVTARRVESARSWLSSYLSQCKAGLRGSLASQRVHSSALRRGDRGNPVQRLNLCYGMADQVSLG